MSRTNPEAQGPFASRGVRDTRAGGRSPGGGRGRRGGACGGGRCPLPLLPGGRLRAGACSTRWRRAGFVWPNRPHRVRHNRFRKFIALRFVDRRGQGRRTSQVLRWPESRLNFFEQIEKGDIHGQRSSAVTRQTSSSVVTPSIALSIPAIRNVFMPSVTA